MATQKSVILITVDCLRADHCGFMGYPRPTTPSLDALARESMVFPAAIVAGVPTYYSFPAIMASRYPLAMGREIMGLPPEENNLASVFRQTGYATAFFGAGNPYLSPQFGYDFGFEVFRDFVDTDFDPPSSTVSNPGRNAAWTETLNGVLETVSHKIWGMGLAYDELYFLYCQRWAAPRSESLEKLRRFPAADVIVDEARAWLALLGGKPFFLWLHFMDPHSPYYPTETAWEMFVEKRLDPARARYLNAYWNRSDLGSNRIRRYRDEVIALYDSGIRWVDAQVARLVNALHDLKLWEDCIFALTADHGEEFLEHDRRYHAPGLSEELIHVPLLLRVPGLPKRVLPRNPFSLLHLAPTLLAAANLPSPAEFQGESLWKQIQEGTAWSDVAVSECISGCTNPFRPELRRGARLLSVREQRYKLSLDFETGDDCLFDLESDPGEHAAVSSTVAKQDRRRLLKIALAHLRGLDTQESSTAYLRARLREISLNLAHSSPGHLSATG